MRAQSRGEPPVLESVTASLTTSPRGTSTVMEVALSEAAGAVPTVSWSGNHGPRRLRVVRRQREDAVVDAGGQICRVGGDRHGLRGAAGDAT